MTEHAADKAFSRWSRIPSTVLEETAFRAGWDACVRAAKACAMESKIVGTVLDQGTYSGLPAIKVGYFGGVALWVFDAGCWMCEDRKGATGDVPPLDQVGETNSLGKQE